MLSDPNGALLVDVRDSVLVFLPQFTEAVVLLLHFLDLYLWMVCGLLLVRFCILNKLVVSTCHENLNNALMELYLFTPNF